MLEKRYQAKYTVLFFFHFSPLYVCMFFLYPYGLNPVNIKVSSTLVTQL